MSEEDVIDETALQQFAERLTKAAKERQAENEPLFEILQDIKQHPDNFKEFLEQAASDGVISSEELTDLLEKQQKIYNEAGKLVESNASLTEDEIFVIDKLATIAEKMFALL